MAYTTINKPSEYFNTVLYTGNGSTNAITGVEFQPDLVWLKSRSITASHQLYDVIRGATKRIQSNTTNAEATEANGLQSFDSDGFTLGLEYDVNNNTSTFASWNWLAGGTGVSNTDGSITSTVSANTTAGFSIIQYTGNSTSGATIGHGLGVEPSVYFCKKTNSSGDNWGFYHKSIGATKYLLLNTNDAEGTSSAPWNDTAPTSSVITLGNATAVNGNTDTFIGYAFAEKKGFSKFSSYTGNFSTDGTFVYTGFKPAMVIIKCSSTGAENWRMFDNKRIGYNPANYILMPSNTNAEDTTGSNIDFLSNGFKIREANGGTNYSGETYIYMAFAENPLVGTNNIPATAR